MTNAIVELSVGNPVRDRDTGKVWNITAIRGNRIELKQQMPVGARGENILVCDASEIDEIFGNA